MPHLLTALSRAAASPASIIVTIAGAAAAVHLFKAASAKAKAWNNRAGDLDRADPARAAAEARVLLWTGAQLGAPLVVLGLSIVAASCLACRT